MKKEKGFFIIFKGFSLKQIKQIFLEGGSVTLNFRNFSLTLKMNFRIRTAIHSHWFCRIIVLEPFTTFLN